MLFAPFIQQKKRASGKRGFTLVELMISISIFVFMTAFLVSKYGTFNGSILVTNVAYDIAITIRQAQAYGLYVRQGIGGNFDSAYGTYFNTGANDEFKLFVDASGDFFYQSSPADEVLNKYKLKKNMSIKSLCASNSDSTCDSSPVSALSVAFKRPDPTAIITTTPGGPRKRYAKIVVAATDGSTRKIIVRDNGQISIEQ
ncbi:MAG: type II secretion system protein [Patescibacteria group bacterium]